MIAETKSEQKTSDVDTTSVCDRYVSLEQIAKSENLLIRPVVRLFGI